MPQHKSEDYNITAVQYYLSKNNNPVKTCKIFKCHPRSLIMRVRNNINQKWDKKNKEKLSIKSAI